MASAVAIEIDLTQMIIEGNHSTPQLRLGFLFTDRTQRSFSILNLNISFHIRSISMTTRNSKAICKYVPLRIVGGASRRLPTTRGRIAVATELYMVGVENRIEEYSNFQDWALIKIADQDRQLLELKNELKALKTGQESMNRRIDHNNLDQNKPTVYGATKTLATPSTTPRPHEMASTAAARITSNVSPMTPCTTGGHRARTVPHSLWDDRSSEGSNKSPPASRTGSKVKSGGVTDGGRNDLFKLTFDETETQSPPPFDSEVDESP